MSLNQYRKSFQIFIPWEREVEDGIILTKYNKGGFQATMELRNYDMDYFPGDAVKIVVRKLNNIFRKLPDGYSFHYEVQRIKTKNYITKNLEGKPLVTRILDKIRENRFKDMDVFETRYYITLSYVIFEDTGKKMDNFFKNKRMIEVEDYREIMKQHQKDFKKVLSNFMESLKRITLETRLLKGKELMEYLYSTINSKRRNNLKIPPKGYFLDSHLSDSNFTDGIDFKINNKYMKTISLSVFPDTAMPRMFKRLEELDFEYRYIIRYIILSKSEAVKLLEGFREYHKGKSRKGSQWFHEMITQKETVNVDMVALEKSGEANSALNDLRRGFVSYGLYTFTFIIMDSDLKKLNSKCERTIEVIEDLGFTAHVEEFNTFEAFAGAIPGNVAMNIRRDPINTALLTYLTPISSIFMGQNWNRHLNDIPLMTVKTGANDLFRFNLHIKDVGHMAMFGRTGGGKSVFLGNIWAQYKKYNNAKVVIFDVKASSMVLTHLMGGEFYNLGKNEMAFQPLSRVDEHDERLWANDWIISLLEQENVVITSKIKKAVWDAIVDLSTVEPARRTMSIFRLHCQDEEAKEALRPYTKLGEYGQYFDNDRDNFKNSHWQAFEMEDIMENSRICGSLLSYIFRRIETDLLRGEPLIIGIDEYGMLSKNPYIEKETDKLLRLSRSKNGLVICATQSLDEVFKSNITSIILDSCKTKVFLPNPSAATTDRELYESLGLNGKEIETIAEAEEQKEYFYQSELGSRLFDMELSKIELIFTGSSSKEDQAKIIEIKNNTNDIKKRIENWIEYKKSTGFINEMEYNYLTEIIGGIYEKDNSGNSLVFDKF